MRIIKVDYDTSSIKGCPTCDYGSNYINDFTVTYDNNEKDNIRIEAMYETLVSESDLMNLSLNFEDRESFLNNIIELCKKMNIGKIYSSEGRLYINNKEVDLHG